MFFVWKGCKQMNDREMLQNLESRCYSDTHNVWPCTGPVSWIMVTSYVVIRIQCFEYRSLQRCIGPSRWYLIRTINTGSCMPNNPAQGNWTVALVIWILILVIIRCRTWVKPTAVKIEKRKISILILLSSMYRTVTLSRLFFYVFTPEQLRYSVSLLSFLSPRTGMKENLWIEPVLLWLRVYISWSMISAWLVLYIDAWNRVVRICKFIQVSQDFIYD